MRVLLVDDEALALDRLGALIADIEGVELVSRAQDGDVALALIAATRPDVVFLDIQMPGRNGLSVAAAIPQPRPELVFVTAHEHFAPDAFDVDATDYILKPVRFERLRQAIERARRRRLLRGEAARAGALEGEIEQMRAARPIAGEREVEFWVPERQGQRRVTVDSIDWIEAARDYVLLHTSLRSHMLRITMSALEEKLLGSALLRVHRSAFVRPARVSEVRRANRSITLVLNDGAQVQVGPSYVLLVEDALGVR